MERKESILLLLGCSHVPRIFLEVLSHPAALRDIPRCLSICFQVPKG